MIGLTTRTRTAKAMMAMATMRISCFSIRVPKVLSSNIWGKEVIRILSGHGAGEHPYPSGLREFLSSGSIERPF
jgi:hypothetical protein